MKPDIDIRQLNAFVDGELDLARQLEIEARMQQDADVRARVETLRELRQTVVECADYHTAPAALRERVTMMVAPQPSAPVRLSIGHAAVQRWVGWRALAPAVGLVVVLALAANLAWWRSVRDDRLTQEVVASHVRSTLGQHLVDVASSDHHTVKPWLSSKLDFSPPVPQLGTPDSVFLGGRVDYLAGRPVAALVYGQGAHVINSFVWPTTKADSETVFLAQRGFQMAHWSRGGMTHWVISDVNRAEFATIVRAIERVGSNG